MGESYIAAMSSSTRILVEVILLSRFAKPLTYAVPEGIPANALLGRRVIVPLQKRQELGVITSTQSRYEGRVREIVSFPDLQPVLSATDVRLCNFIAEYYCCSLAEAVRSFLPQLLSRRLGQNLAIRSREKLRIHAESGNLAAQMILEKVPRRRTLAARHLETLPREPLRQLIEGEVIEMIWQVRGSRPQLENMQLKQGANLGGAKPGRVHRELFERLAAGEALTIRKQGISTDVLRKWYEGGKRRVWSS